MTKNNEGGVYFESCVLVTVIKYKKKKHTLRAFLSLL